MAGRHVGTVCYLSPDHDHAELTVEGMQPVAASRTDLRAIKAERLGAVVSWEHGTTRLGASGAVNLRPEKER